MRGIVIVSPGGLERGGGIGSVTRGMRGWLAANRPDIPVFVLDPRGRGSKLLSPVLLLVAAIRLCWLRAAGKADILHLQVSEGGSFARKGLLLRLGRWLGMRTVLHHHGGRLEPFLKNCNGLAFRFVRRSIELADINLVLGEAPRRLLADRCALPPEQFVVLRNATADPGLRRHAPDHPHYLMAAVLDPRKGTGDSLQAMARLGVNASATLAGEGDIAGYAALADRLGISSRVRFTGWLEPAALAHLHTSSTALVLPSRQEGMPMAILEALASGLPVITTPVGVIPEVLVDGETALLVPPGDVAALARAMARLASDPELAENLAGNGRRLYERAFDLERYMLRLLALYDMIPVHDGQRRVTVRQPQGHHDIGDH